jgi:hypothetical protein
MTIKPFSNSPPSPPSQPPLKPLGFRASGKAEALAQPGTVNVDALKHAEQSVDRLLVRAAAEDVEGGPSSALGHDIRSTLNAILGYVHLLRQGTDRDTRQDRYLTSVHTNSERLLSLVDELLAKRPLGLVADLPESPLLHDANTPQASGRPGEAASGARRVSPSLPPWRVSPSLPPLRVASAQLPLWVRDGLKEAVSAGHYSNIGMYLDQVDTHDIRLGRRLRKLADRFAYGRLLDILQGLDEETG